MRHRRVRTIGMAVLAASAAACAAIDAPGEASATGGALQLRFEDVLAPGAFAREGPAVADAPDGAPGFWAAVPDLPRPERAVIENVATGAQTTVALYRGSGGAILVSGAAAEALGLGPAPAPVRVTALRREPRIAGP